MRGITPASRVKNRLPQLGFDHLYHKPHHRTRRIKLARISRRVAHFLCFEGLGQWQDTEGKPKKEWYFRHDKIMDFFLVQNFLGERAEAESRLIDHMGDPRFRGVYFLLATLLPLDDAKQLREKLIQYAADTKDHTVSDTFVQLLRTR